MFLALLVSTLTPAFADSTEPVSLENGQTASDAPPDLDREQALLDAADDVAGWWHLADPSDMGAVSPPPEPVWGAYLSPNMPEPDRTRAQRRGSRSGH